MEERGLNKHYKNYGRYYCDYQQSHVESDVGSRERKGLI